MIRAVARRPARSAPGVEGTAETSGPRSPRGGEFWANPEDLVFTSPTGRPTDPTHVRSEFGKVAKRAGLGDGWTPNDLRHTAASLMADAGVAIEEVADQLGHRDTRMASLHYRHRIKATVSAGTVLGDVLGGTS